MNLLWTAEDVIRAVHAQCLHEQHWAASGISIDSRTLKSGDIFIALKGPTHDGHDHINAAFTSGAVAAIASQPPHVSANKPVILCDDTFEALNQLGRAGRQRSTASIVAVTGSVGKTGTKEMLRLMLGANGDTYANEGSLNNHWGVPLSLARLPADARFGVFELGMNHAGELTTLSQLVTPKICLITTIEAVHLEFFDSITAIADAKAEIFLGVDRDGAALLNRDNPQFGRLASAAKKAGIKRILSFGRDSKADARILSFAAMPTGSLIEASVLGKKIHYSLSASGEHLALNSIGALLAAVETGGDLEACANALAHYQIPQGRGAAQKLMLATGEITLIDESYNASPAAVRAAIRVLSSMQPVAKGRRVLVLGDMRELGKDGPELHRSLAEDINRHNIDIVHCCGELMKNLYDHLPAEKRGLYATDSLALATKLVRSLQAGDVVTVKGSLSTRMKLIVEAIKSSAAKELAKQKSA